ncbi:hypothetical protein, partial [Salmonella sp. s51228]|uniref:hypothetical protein n=1 Tax=Salmonella sp. s51228 TaxID=3159652 RepID=UPI00398136AF
TVSVHTMTSLRRKVESELTIARSEYDEAVNDARNKEEQAKKAMMDAMRLAEELRSEQDHSMHSEKMRKQLELALKDMQARLDEAEAQALKGGRRMIQKLEQRVKELEHDLEAEQRRRGDTE